MDSRYSRFPVNRETLNQGQNLHFIFLELCARPEYIELIRSEIEGMKDPLDHEEMCQLPILDSFVKESVRLNPLDKSRRRSDHSSMILSKADTFLLSNSGDPP